MEFDRIDKENQKQIEKMTFTEQNQEILKQIKNMENKNSTKKTMDIEHLNLREQKQILESVKQMRIQFNNEGTLDTRRYRSKYKRSKIE